MYRKAYSELSLHDGLMLYYEWCTNRIFKKYNWTPINIFWRFVDYGNYWILFFENKANAYVSWLHRNVWGGEASSLDLMGWEQVITDEIEMPVEKRIMFVRVGFMGAKIDGVIYTWGDYWLDVGELETIKISGQLKYKFLDTYLISKTDSIIKNKIMLRVEG